MAKEVWRGLEDLLASWKTVDFAARQDEMDRAALALSEQKEANLAARKALQEKTKAFQKLADDGEKLAEIGPLIRAYQKEVDALTKRAKLSEATFLELYKWLREAPDPTLAVGNALARKGELGGSRGATEEALALRGKLNDYEKEFRELKNQEVTIENLKLTVQQYQEQLEEAIKKGVETQLQDEGAKQLTLLDSLRENEQRLQRQLRQQQEELRRTLADHDSSQKQLLQLSAALEEARAQRESVDLVLQNEVEALAAKAQMLELENSQLRASRADKPAPKNSDDLVDALHDELLRKDQHLARAVDQQLALEARLRQEEQAVRDAQRQLAEARSVIDTLQDKLQLLPNQADFDNLRKRLQALEDIDRSLAEDTDGGANSGADGDRPERQAQRLKQNIAKARVQALDATAQLGRMSAQVDELKRQVQFQADVIQRLDADASNKYGVSLDLTGAEADSRGPVLDVSTQKVPNSGSPAPASIPWEENTATPGLVQLLVGQRDQLRSRVKELENEKQQLERTARSLRAEVQQLKTDNLTLYGKARTLASATVAAGSDRGNGRRRAVLDDEELDLRYRRQYDEALLIPESPAFRDRDGAAPRLSAPERITLNTARLLLATQYGRYGVLLYVALLHFLVMATLYKLSHGAHMTKA
eukprot:EG_transcript_5652